MLNSSSDPQLRIPCVDRPSFVCPLIIHSMTFYIKTWQKRGIHPSNQSSSDPVNRSTIQPTNQSPSHLCYESLKYLFNQSSIQNCGSPCICRSPLPCWSPFPPSILQSYYDPLCWKVAEKRNRWQLINQSIIQPSSHQWSSQSISHPGIHLMSQWYMH